MASDAWCERGRRRPCRLRGKERDGLRHLRGKARGNPRDFEGRPRSPEGEGRGRFFLREERPGGREENRGVHRRGEEGLGVSPKRHVNASREREISISRPGGACQCLEGEGNVDFPTRRGMSMPRGRGKCRFPDPEGHVNASDGMSLPRRRGSKFPASEGEGNSIS